MPALGAAPALTGAHVTRPGRWSRQPSGTPRRPIARRGRGRHRGRPRRVAPTRRPRPRARQHVRPTANAAPSPCEAAGNTVGDHGGLPLCRCRATGPPTHTTQRECRPIAVRQRGRPRRVAPTRMPRHGPANTHDPPRMPPHRRARPRATAWATTEGRPCADAALSARQHTRPTANAAPSPCEAARDTVGDHGGSPLHGGRGHGPAGALSPNARVDSA